MEHIPAMKSETAPVTSIISNIADELNGLESTANRLSSIVSGPTPDTLDKAPPINSDIGIREAVTVICNRLSAVNEQLRSTTSLLGEG